MHGSFEEIIRSSFLHRDIRENCFLYADVEKCEKEEHDSTREEKQKHRTKWNCWLKDICTTDTRSSCNRKKFECTLKKKCVQSDIVKQASATKTLPSPFSVSAKKGSNLCNIPEIHNILKLQPSSVKCREHETQRTNNG
ncbi:hypothetical protein ANTRET_LOCUS3820 [Anthophora retusa]